QQVVPKRLCRGAWKIQDSNPRHGRRNGLSRSLHAVVAVLHRDATPKRAFETAHLPRRRPLHHQAAKQPTLVQDLSGLARYLPEVGEGIVSGASAASPTRCPRVSLILLK